MVGLGEGGDSVGGCKDFMVMGNENLQEFFTKQDIQNCK